MAYTIKPEKSATLNRISLKLAMAVIADGRFTCDIKRGDKVLTIRKVRLTEAKEYCGQHPGPCQINPFGFERKRMRTKYLEGQDWIDFHNIVNDVLDKLKVKADVWTLPLDVRGKMWVRRADLGRRHRWDYTDDGTRQQFGQQHNVWNKGTPDQFQAVA